MIKIIVKIQRKAKNKAKLLMMAHLHTVKMKMLVRR